MKPNRIGSWSLISELLLNRINQKRHPDAVQRIEAQ